VHKSQYGDTACGSCSSSAIARSAGRARRTRSKIAAFFIERDQNGDVKGRFVRGFAERDSPGANSGQFVFTISLIDPALSNQ
jgi:hypothetical protein